MIFHGHIAYKEVLILRIEADEESSKSMTTFETVKISFKN